MGIRQDFKKARQIVYANRYYALAMFFLLIFFTIVGFYFPSVFPQEQAGVLREILSLTYGKGFFELALIIILNNLRTCLIGIVFGVFFGLVPLFSVIGNGYFLGSVLNQAYSRTGFLTFFLIVPHGVFEIPALAISFGLGFKIGLWYKERKKLDYIRSNLNEAMLVYVLIIFPLLIIAGIIESGLIHLFK